MLLSSSSLAFAFLSYSAILFSWAIPFGNDTGILYRFSLTSSNETEELLSWAELREWDLWQTTRSHVDVYFPRRAIAEAELELLPIPLAPGSTSSHRVDGRTGTQHRAAHGGSSASPPSSDTFHTQYHPLDEIEGFVHALAAAYPRQVSVVRLGHSGEGREMFALEITAAKTETDTAGTRAGAGACADRHRVSHDQNSQVVLNGKGKGEDDNGADPRCGFLITGAQHAREWVASASALYVAQALLANSSEKFSLAHLLERYNFYIVPVPNPDGYVYTWEQDRFWYKNRLQLGPEARCVGVDMNRNWGYKWKAASRESHMVKPRRRADPCSHWYPGSRPFQAPEVNNMENYFSRLPHLKGFLDLRSYGQMLSTPFSYSCEKSPKDAEDQLEAISGAAHAIKKSHGTVFTTGALCSTLYRAPGNIVDWMYKRKGVKYSFAAHLRDTGTYGFALPEQWIRPVGEETTRMIEYLAKFIECR